jgi:hypothetical protein
LSENVEEYLNLAKSEYNFGILHGIDEIKKEVELYYIGHHQYDWVRPRKCWLETSKPVYIDFGNDYLCRLEKYDESNLKCIRLISKRKIVHDLMHETNCLKLASRFYIF